MPDYANIIDQETWDFIRETEKWYGPDTHTLSIKEHRQRYDAMCREFFSGYPDGVRADDLNADGVPIRIYSREHPQNGCTVLFAHGGSLMLGGLDSHDDVCAEICGETGYDVVAVDYRLAPEFSRQHALADIQTVLNWVRREQGGKVISVGDSAGGFLVASNTHANRDVGDIVGTVLIYPGLSFSRKGGSIEEHAFAPLLTKAEILSYRDVLDTGATTDQLGVQSPLHADGLAQLPLTITMSAECDPIADDARDYADAINTAGGRAFWFEDKGLVHGHLRARHTVKRARRSFDRVLRAIRLIGAGRPFTRDDLQG